VRTEFHIANIAVRRDRHRRGIGKWLLERALAEGRRLGCILASLEVRRSNRGAIRLYESRNFRPIAIRKGYYVDNGEDAIVMVYDLAGDPEG
jgi:ribosomal-protein-alanine N-acetyltransferase